MEITWATEPEYKTWGRNGASAAMGLQIKNLGPCVLLHPINSKGDIGKARLVIPIDHAAQVSAAILAEAAQALAEGGGRPARGAAPQPAPAGYAALLTHPDSHVRCCVEAMGGRDPRDVLAEAAIALHGAGFGSKSRPAFAAWQQIGDAMVALNGNPTSFRGPLNPDGPEYPFR